MLSDVIAFVQSRKTCERSTALREINFAWKELWKINDLPNSIQEISVKQPDLTPIITLPWYVGVLRGVKETNWRNRVILNTPRPYYQDDTYLQTPYTWRILGTSPLNQSIINATTLNVSIAAPEEEQFVVVLLGTDDHGHLVKDTVTFEIGETSKSTAKRFVDCSSITKSIITNDNIAITTAEGVEVALIPNSEFAARNTWIQVMDKCNKICDICRCWDVLFKLAPPYLYFDEQEVPSEEALMTKTLEWMELAKDNGTEKALTYNQKTIGLLTAENSNQGSIDKVLDIARNPHTRYYAGRL